MTRLKFELDTLDFEDSKESLAIERFAALGFMINRFSHRINNCNHVVTGMLNLLQMNEPTDGKDLLGKFRSMDLASRNGSSLITQIMEFSHAKGEESWEDINHLLRRCSGLFKLSLPGSVKFELSLDPAVPLVLMYGCRFENLLIFIACRCLGLLGSSDSILVGTEFVESGDSMRVFFEGRGPGPNLAPPVRDTHNTEALLNSMAERAGGILKFLNGRGFFELTFPLFRRVQQSEDDDIKWLI